MKTEHTAQFLKKRKFYVVLPILVIPFLTLGFYSMGGGKSQKQDHETHNSLSRVLPEAKVSTEPLDKMSIYNQATKDTLALQEGRMQNNSDRKEVQNYPPIVYGQPQPVYGNDYPGAYNPGYSDQNESRVKAKLEELNRVMNQQSYPVSNSTKLDDQNQVTNSRLSRMEEMINGVGGSNTADPEIQQLNSMLEKIIDIQNPGRAQERLKQFSGQHKGRVFAVNQIQKQYTADLLKVGVLKNNSAFYDLDQGITEKDTLLQLAIPAVIHETQTLVSGATVKMRLTESIYVNGVLIPDGTFVSGISNIDGERLKIEVSGIRIGNMINPVSLVVYDMDAIEGIRIPGAITRDSAKEGADRALQSIQLMSLDPSAAGMATGAGIEAAKGLLGKKVKLIRVTVKAGHPLLFVDLKNKQESN